jgi:hypothetical protein
MWPAALLLDHMPQTANTKLLTETSQKPNSRIPMQYEPMQEQFIVIYTLLHSTAGLLCGYSPSRTFAASRGRFHYLI